MTTHEAEYTVSLPETWVPIPDDLAVFEPLPQDWYSDDHHYIYGWAVSFSWLKTYFRQHRLQLQPPEFINCDAVFHMRSVTKYHHIFPQPVLPDDETRKNGMVIPSDDGPGDYVEVLALTCTRNRRYFHQRPSPKVMKKLEELFGAKPRWFRQYEKREQFEPETWIY